MVNTREVVICEGSRGKQHVGCSISTFISDFMVNVQLESMLFDSAQADQLRQKLPELDLSQPLNQVRLPHTTMHNYLEFYGFFETFKRFDVDYFWGVRNCRCGSSVKKVATHFWRLDESIGTVFLVHGLFDHVGIYQKITAHLLSQGFSVIAVDLPGHGLSEGGATEIESFSDYGDVVGDTLTYFTEEVTGKPVVAVGQSTGAAVLMSLCFDRERQNRRSPFDRIVFLGPLVRPRKWLLGRLAYRMFGGFMRHVQRDLSHPNSHDHEFHTFLRYYDCLQPRRLCITWVGALHQWVETFAKQPVLKTPLMVVQGTADMVVDWKFNVRAIGEHFTGMKVCYVDGAMHHLANEAQPWLKVIFKNVGQFLRNPASDEEEQPQGEAS